jgi:hypothetical protein
VSQWCGPCVDSRQPAYSPRHMRDTALQELVRLTLLVCLICAGNVSIAPPPLVHGVVCYLLPAAMAEHSVRQVIGAHVFLRFTSIESTGKRAMYSEKGPRSCLTAQTCLSCRKTSDCPLWALISIPHHCSTLLKFYQEFCFSRNCSASAAGVAGR